jgi:hypothetical protein
MRMRAEHMPEPVDHSWPAGMAVPVAVDMTGAGRAGLYVTHDAQDA